MNRRLETEPAFDAAALADFVGTGLAVFAAKCLEAPPQLFQELDRARELSARFGASHLTFSELAACVDEARERLPSRLGGFVRDFALETPELFVAALCGELERDARIGWALRLLTGTREPGHPSLELVGSLLSSLFDVRSDATSLARLSLVRGGALALGGSGPLPGFELSMAPELWACLLGSKLLPAGCSPLGSEALPLARDASRLLDETSRLLESGRVRTLVLRGDERSASTFAIHAAARLGREAIRLGSRAERPLSLVARYAGWLPVLVPRFGAGEVLELGDDELAPPTLVLLGRDGNVVGPGVLDVAVPGLALDERATAWRAALPELARPERLAEGALLGAELIALVAQRARSLATARGEKLEDAHVVAARAQASRGALEKLTQLDARRVTRDALVLEPELERALARLIGRCRRRERLADGLGASLECTRTTRVCALFIGESGTGKTLSAGYLASELGAPLCRLDLGQVLNKYVGETEKQLGSVLDAAASLDVVLLLDEADALFGRRSESSETGERYANMLTNYLLTRIEHHPGIVILTSNSLGRIDSAFLRRFDAVLEFGLPDAEDRRRLWHAHLGRRSPGEEFVRLIASFTDLAGGGIRNAVLAAAAHDDRPSSEPLGTASVLDGIRAEYQKTGRDLPAQLKGRP